MARSRQTINKRKHRRPNTPMVITHVTVEVIDGEIGTIPLDEYAAMDWVYTDHDNADEIWQARDASELRRRLDEDDHGPVGQAAHHPYEGRDDQPYDGFAGMLGQFDDSMLPTWLPTNRGHNTRVHFPG